MGCLDAEEAGGATQIDQVDRNAQPCREATAGVEE